jgi:hypothetical protein
MTPFVCDRLHSTERSKAIDSAVSRGTSSKPASTPSPSKPSGSAIPCVVAVDRVQLAEEPDHLRTSLGEKRSPAYRPSSDHSTYHHLYNHTTCLTIRYCSHNRTFRNSQLVFSTCVRVASDTSNLVGAKNAGIRGYQHRAGVGTGTGR